MRRREFTLLLASALARPPTAQAQQAERVRRIGMFLPRVESEQESMARSAAFLQALGEHGWTVGRNLRVEYRWSTGDAERTRRDVAEMVALAPEVIIVPGSAVLGTLLQATRTVPVVFVHVPDPVGAGFVDSLARPGGNATGFISYEYSMSGKWLELLKEIAPDVKRTAVLRDARIASGIGQFSAIQSVAPSLGIEVSPVNVHAAAEIERAIAAFARVGKGSLILTSSALSAKHSDFVIKLAARHKLPAVYWERAKVVAGGLAAYGPNFIDQFRRAAGYVDRILKGEKPADLPVQAPTKFELAINLKTAKALGLAVPQSLLARADEVIE